MTRKELVTSLTRTSVFLRWVLLADASTSGATGLLLMFCAGFAEGLLGIPAMLMRYAGLSLLPFAVLVAYLATRENLSRPAVCAVISCNALWAADSVLLLLSARLEPTVLGHAFIIVQALVVATFAELEYLGLRRPMARTHEVDRCRNDRVVRVPVGE